MVQAADATAYGDINPQSVSDEDIGDQIIIAAGVFIALQTIFVVLRFVARLIGKSRFGIDDWFIIPSWLSGIGLCVCSILLVRWTGTGHHRGWVMVHMPNAILSGIKFELAFAFLYQVGVFFPKMSILFLYRRIFVTRPYRIANYFLMAVLTSIVVAVVLTTLLMCQPFGYFYRALEEPGLEGHCVDIDMFWRWGTFPNIVTDIAMLILPMPVLWNVQMSKKDRIGLMATFALGSSGLIASTTRFVFFYQTTATADSFNTVKLIAISIIEVGVYIIAACLPPCRSFYIVLSHRNKDSNLPTSQQKLSYGRSFQSSRTNEIGLSSLEPKLYHQPASIRRFEGFQRLSNEETNRY